MNKKLSEYKVRRIVCDVVEIGREFVCDTLPCDLVGMNSKLMSQYIDFVVDRLLVSMLRGFIFCTNQNRYILMIHLLIQ